MFQFLQPKEQLSSAEVRRGLMFFIIQSTVWQFLGVLSLGVYLTALVLELGGTNWDIGLISAFASLSAVMQIPGAILVEKLRHRKLVSWVIIAVNRVIVLLIPALVFLLKDNRYAVVVGIIILMASFNILSNLSGPGFGSWQRDLIPSRVRARFLANQQRALTAVSMILGPLSAFLAEYLKHSGYNLVVSYSIIILIGGVIALLSIFTCHQIPEPKMEPMEPKSYFKFLLDPLRDANFRQWTIYNVVFAFGIALISPFIIVHMLKRLDLNMYWVQGLAFASQAFVVGLSGFAARLTDHFNGKSVLIASNRLLILILALWAFTMTAKPSAYIFIPLLIIIHILSGISGIGRVVSSGALFLKLIPKSSSSAHQATGAILAGSAAAIGSLIGGKLGDWFEAIHVSMPFSLAYNGDQLVSVPALSFSGIDFLFFISAIICTVSLVWLHRIKETREVGEKMVVSYVYEELQRMLRNVAHVAGVKYQPSETEGSAAAMLSRRTKPQEPPVETTDEHR